MITLFFYILSNICNTDNGEIDEEQFAPTAEELRPRDPQTSESEMDTTRAQELAKRIKTKELKAQKKLRANVCLRFLNASSMNDDFCRN